MKILLLGKNGQLGWELMRSLAPLGELVALDARSTDHCGDIANPDGLARTIKSGAPDVIVNAAAYTAVDKAETECDLARKINAEGPATLARLASQTGAWLVQYSTDYVFDGSGDQGWKETDQTSPLNVYGKTKREGELAIMESGCRYLIFRTSWVYGMRGANFAKTMLKLAQEREQLSVICDQSGAPTGAELLADVTSHCILKAQQRPELAGLYHLAAGGVTTWYDYACFVIGFARASGVSIKVAPDAIRAIRSKDFITAAPRPMNSLLCTQKLQDMFDLNLPSWQTSLTRTLTEICENKK